MTPDQIFKAESKLRELKKIEDALAAFDGYVFSGTAETVPGSKTPPFPWGNSDMSRHLRDGLQSRLIERRQELHLDLCKAGVDFSMSVAEVMAVAETIGKVTP